MESDAPSTQRYTSATAWNTQNIRFFPLPISSLSQADMESLSSCLDVHCTTEAVLAEVWPLQGEKIKGHNTTDNPAFTVYTTLNTTL